MPKLYIDAKIDVHDKNGNLEETTGWQPCHSLVEQFIQILRVQTSTVADANIRDVTNFGVTIINEGVLRNVDRHSNNFSLLAPVGDGQYGPVLGTAATAVNIEATRLGTIIVEGTVAGQLLHQATTTSGVVVTALQTTLVITRQFVNNSAGGITPQEIGIYARGTVTPFVFMIGRDLLSVVIAATRTATLQIRFLTTDVGCIAFFQILQSMMTQTAVTATDVNGVGRGVGVVNGVNLDSTSYRMNGILNEGWGVRVGRGSPPAAFSPNNTALTLLITPGTGANQLTHLANIHGSILVVGANLRYIVTRTFVNDSGATLSTDLSEVCIHVNNPFQSGGGFSAAEFLIAREDTIAVLTVTANLIVVVDAQIQI